MVKARKCDLCGKTIEGPVVETKTSAGGKVWLCERCAVSEGVICETPTRRPGDIVVGLTPEEWRLVEALRIAEVEPRVLVTILTNERHEYGPMRDQIAKVVSTFRREAKAHE